MAAELSLDGSQEVTVGGDPAIDFANSFRGLHDDPHGKFSSYRDAMVYAVRTGLLEHNAEIERLVHTTHPEGSQETEALQDLLAIRDATYRIFSALACEKAPSDSDLEILKSAAGDAVHHANLTGEAGTFRMSWDGTDASKRVARPLAAHAMDLLLSDDRSRIKQCPDETCGWLFLDKSKNASRRWCSMEVCGSRAKMRSHYRRKKSLEA